MLKNGAFSKIKVQNSAKKVKTINKIIKLWWDDILSIYKEITLLINMPLKTRKNFIINDFKKVKWSLKMWINNC